MTLSLADRGIERVSLVDDDSDTRDSWEWTVEDLGAKPQQVSGFLSEIDDVLKSLDPKRDAVLCDYQMSGRQYASFTGDVLAAECYRRGIAVVLCSTYLDATFTIPRFRRRLIPAVIRATNLDPDTLRSGFLRCVEEFHGTFAPSRRASRAQVKIVDIHEKTAYVNVPSRNSAKIPILIDELPAAIQSVIEVGKRLHAIVNVGAERDQDLYFDDWTVG